MKSSAPLAADRDDAPAASNGERVGGERLSGSRLARRRTTPTELEADVGQIRVLASPADNFREVLATKKLRLTRERQILIEEVFAEHSHFDAEQLIDRLGCRDDGRRVSRATIYRTLALLEEAGLIRKVARQDERDVYEHRYGYPRHDHLICRQCGSLTEFAEPRIGELLEEIAAARGFRMSGYRLEVDGLCDACAGPPKTRPKKLNLM